MRHPSTSTGMPPSDVTATTAKSRACGYDFAAWMRFSVSSGFPHSSSTRTTSAPQRIATSHLRLPKTPLTATTAMSPGSSRLTKHASMPAEPVPLIGSVSALRVRNTVRSRAIVSSSSARNSGSMCPSNGRASAAVASGYGFDGPGPRRSRSLGTTSRILRAGVLETARRQFDTYGSPERESDRREDGGPVLGEEAHDRAGRRPRDEAAGHVGGGARDPRDVGVGEGDPGSLGRLLHGVRGVTSGVRGLPRATGVAQHLVDRDRGPPPVDLVGERVGSQRGGDAPQLVGVQVSKRIGEPHRLAFGHGGHSPRPAEQSGGYRSHRRPPLPPTRVSARRDGS